MISSALRGLCALLASALLLTSFAVAADDSIILPIDGEFEVGQSIGAKRKGHRHQGIDLFADEGTPVVAIADGVVLSSNKGPRQGWAVRIQHESGVTTFYAHLMKRSELRKGDYVAQGDLIGYVGEAGNASTPHLHFELRQNGKVLDPRDYYEEMQRSR